MNIRDVLMDYYTSHGTVIHPVINGIGHDEFVPCECSLCQAAKQALRVGKPASEPDALKKGKHAKG